MENRSNAISLLLSLGCKLLYNPEAALAMVTHEERGPEIMCLKWDKKR
jgi:transient receptor potential cation channel subfamily A member 1